MKIAREEAKSLLARAQVAILEDREKRRILGEYWDFGRREDVERAIAEGDLPHLGEAAIAAMASGTIPDGPITAEFDPLLLDWHAFKLEKVLNSYIEKQLRAHGVEAEVYGAVEDAGLCPCCDYYAIDPGEEGVWDICPVCFWENGGDGPNHMSLVQARENFRVHGAMSEAHRQHVDPDGSEKYRRGERE